MNGDRFTKSKRSDARTIGWMKGAIAYTAMAFQDYKRWNVSGMLEYQADHVRERTFRTPSLFSVVMRLRRTLHVTTHFLSLVTLVVRHNHLHIRIQLPSRCPTFLTPPSLFEFSMDFSNFNPAEQAHMTKIIEKKQV